MKILIVEDNPKHQESAIEQLGGDHEVTVVSTAREAIQLIQESQLAYHRGYRDDGWKVVSQEEEMITKQWGKEEEEIKQKLEMKIINQEQSRKLRNDLSNKFSPLMTDINNRKKEEQNERRKKGMPRNDKFDVMITDLLLPEKPLGIALLFAAVNAKIPFAGILSDIGRHPQEEFLELLNKSTGIGRSEDRFKMQMDATCVVFGNYQSEHGEDDWRKDWKTMLERLTAPPAV